MGTDIFTPGVLLIGLLVRFIGLCLTVAYHLIMFVLWVLIIVGLLLWWSSSSRRRCRPFRAPRFRH